LCAVLLYLALDLSLPMLPGAFEFAPDASVESIRENRSYGGGEGVVARQRAVDPPRLTAPALIGRSPAGPHRPEPVVRPVARRARASLVQAPLDRQDPH
jgi:hypothetical protein